MQISNNYAVQTCTPSGYARLPLRSRASAAHGVCGVLHRSSSFIDMSYLKFIHQQAKALADAAAFKQFDRTRVVEFLRFFNGTGSLGNYSKGERLLAAWLTTMLNTAPPPLEPATNPSAPGGAGVTPPFSVLDFARAASALNVPAESLVILVDGLARQTRTGAETP